MPFRNHRNYPNVIRAREIVTKKITIGTEPVSLTDQFEIGRLQELNLINNASRNIRLGSTDNVDSFIFVIPIGNVLRIWVDEDIEFSYYASVERGQVKMDVSGVYY